MNLVLILLFSFVAIGLTVRRMTPLVWLTIWLWTTLVVTFFYLKH